MWIAKDIDGSLYVYENKPERDGYLWYVRHGTYFELHKSLISQSLCENLKWNDDPIEIEIEIKRK